MRTKIINCVICALMIASILVIEVPKGVNAQVTEEWVARYDGPANDQDTAYDIALDSSGNVYVTGLSYGESNNKDIVTIAYDTNGNELWVARYNDPRDSWDWASAITLDPFGNILVAGASSGYGTHSNYITIKYDKDGNQLWVATYNGPGNNTDIAYTITTDQLGNVYVAGRSYGGTNDDYATVVYDSSGNELWSARYNGPGNGNDWIEDIVVDPLGNVYVTGASHGSSWTSMDYATIKYDKDGNKLWVARYVGPHRQDWAYAIELDSAGNVYITGTSYSSTIDFDYVTVAYDSSGNELWIERYDGSGNSDDLAEAMCIDINGNLYVTGSSVSPNWNLDITTVVYDSSGNELWVARYDGPGNWTDKAYDVTLNESSGEVYVTGYSHGNGTDKDYVTIAYDSSGNEIWVARYNGPGNGEDSPWAIAVDSIGDVYITGESEGSGTDYDFTTIKYSRREPILQVTIDIDPDTLNLKSKGRWITAYITLPEGYDVNDMDISTILLEDTIPAEWGDIQGDTLMIKFDRSEVEDMLSPGTYNLKVNGELMDGTAFEGYSDEIRVIGPG